MKNAICSIALLTVTSCQQPVEIKEPSLFEQNKQEIESFQSSPQAHSYLILEEKGQTDIYHLNSKTQELTNMTKTDSICENTLIFQDEYIAYFAESSARQDVHIYNTTTKDGKNLTLCNPHVIKSSETFTPQTYIKLLNNNKLVRTNSFSFANATYKK